MNLSLNPQLQKLIAERIDSGKYATPEEVVTAALHSLHRDERLGDFEAGEWDELLANAEAGGASLDGEAVLAELRELRSRHQDNAG